MNNNFLRLFQFKIDKFEKNNFAFIFYCFILLAIIIMSALNTSITINFYPINGTFQNYNPVRRLISGQVPFVDFYDYLGLGHLYLGSALTYILGNNFHASLIAFDLLTLLSMSLIYFSLGYAISNNKIFSIRLTILITLIMAINLIFHPEIHFSGNSARLIRGMFLSLIFIFWFFKDFLILKFSYLNKNQDRFQIVYWGIISGFSFLWSNDYGISCWLCILLYIFLNTYIKTNKLIRSLFITLISLSISSLVIYCCINLITNGNIYNWYNFIFGSGSFQAWYYNSDKSFFLWDLDFSKGIILQYFITFIYFTKIYKNPKETIPLSRYTIPFFANLASLCAANEYRLLSGSYNHEVAYCVLYATIIFEIIKFISERSNFKLRMLFDNITIIFVTLASIICLITLSINYHKNIIPSINNTYFEQLGGNMTKLNDDLINTAKFLNNAHVFSTYASAQEILSGNFQPSGIDYIIHTLGYNARNSYLSSFKLNNFDYASTVKDSFTDWEHWIKRANWFFYRELYMNWHPIYANSYQLYWAPNNIGSEDNFISGNFAPKIVNINDPDLKAKKIILNLDQNISGIADVYIDYKTENIPSFKSKIFSNFIIRKLVEIKNTGFNFANLRDMDRNYLPSSGREFIPITIINGYGEVMLSSYPSNYTNVIINDIKCNKIFTIDFNYLEIDKIKYTNDNIILMVNNTQKNKYILQNARKIKINNLCYNIQSINQNANYYFINIYKSERALKQFKNLTINPNCVYVIKA